MRLEAASELSIKWRISAWLWFTSTISFLKALPCHYFFPSILSTPHTKVGPVWSLSCHEFKIWPQKIGKNNILNSFLAWFTRIKLYLTIKLNKQSLFNHFIHFIPNALWTIIICLYLPQVLIQISSSQRGLPRTSI